MKILCAFTALGAALVATPLFAQTTLNVSSWLPPTHPVVTEMVMPWCKDVESGTAGRIKCNLLPKPVVSALLTIDGVKDGLADLSFTVHGYTPGRFPLTKAVEFPFMGDSAEVTSVAWHRIYTRMLAQADEHKGVVNLAMFTHGPGQILNTKRAINTVADLDGLKIRVGGGVASDVAKALGTVPMMRPAPEVFEILKTGVADGVFFPKESVRSFKLETLIKHATIVPGGLYNVSFTLMINPASYAKIAKADQDVIQRFSGEAFARRAGKAWDAGDERGMETMRGAAIDLRTASEALMREIRTRTDPLVAEWAEKEAKPKGVDGNAVLAALRAEIRNVAAGR